MQPRYTEQAGDTDQMLICDGCDALVHTSCAGLLAVPVGDWLCGGKHTIRSIGNHISSKHIGSSLN